MTMEPSHEVGTYETHALKKEWVRASPTTGTGRTKCDQYVTLAETNLAHDLIGQIGMDLARELLDVIDSDALLRPELVSVAGRAANLLDHEFGTEAAATSQVKSVVQHALRGLQA